MKHHHAEFQFQLIRYLVAMASHDDIELLNQYGLESIHHAALSQLTCGDLERIVHNIPETLFHLSIDMVQLERLICCCQNHQSDRQLIQQLLESGASYPVLNRLYGLTSSDVATLRKQLSLPHSQGRPISLSDAQQDQVYRLWQASNHLNIAQRLLHLHQHTAIAIRSLWPYLNEWFLIPDNHKS
ncbi:MAG: STY4526/YPO1902 family pathogenicity island replication protein [Methylococcales bacterium]